ncbi:unnamed protein product [Closterium sp. Yama58-4]|nr:unnamed protein product [Closterium sp. Yama58-4]
MALPRPRQVFVLLLAAVVVTSSLISNAQAKSESISFGGYTVYDNGTIVDASGAAVTPTVKADESVSIGGYTRYSNGTVTDPNGSVILAVRSGSYVIGSTIMYENDTFTDLSGNVVRPVWNGPYSVTAGDLTLWGNGTVTSTKSGVVIHTGPTSLSSLNPASKAASPIKPGYLATVITMAAGFALLLA